LSVVLGLIWGLSCENSSKKADQRVVSTPKEEIEAPPAEEAERGKVDTFSWKVLSEAEFLELRGEPWESFSTCKRPISSLRKEPIRPDKDACSDRSLFAYTFKVGQHEISLRDDSTGLAVYTPEGECLTDEGNVVIFSHWSGMWCDNLKYLSWKIFTPLSKEPLDLHMGVQAVYVWKKGLLLIWCELGDGRPVVEVVDLRTGDRYTPDSGLDAFMENEGACLWPLPVNLPIDKDCAPIKGVYRVKGKKTACILHIEGENMGRKMEQVGDEYVVREVQKYVRLYLLLEWR